MVALVIPEIAPVAIVRALRGVYEAPVLAIALPTTLSEHALMMQRPGRESAR
jgi:hypothetical protein